MKNSMRFLSGIVLVLLSLMAAGCPKNTGTATMSEDQKQREAAAAAAAGATNAENSGVRHQELSSREQKGQASERVGDSSSGLEPVFFDYDKALIRTGAKPVMAANAAWLKAHPKTKIRIGGDCDERGTIEYNQALGQRRAAAAKKYLTDLGIAGSRITLISYGKEKPVCQEGTEACWQKNRRDDFKVNN